jgi:hypothetical protein
VKAVRIEATLHYDDELIHGDDALAKDWFMKELHRIGSASLMLAGDFGDRVGELSNITLKEAE